MTPATHAPVGRIVTRAGADPAELRGLHVQGSGTARVLVAYATAGSEGQTQLIAARLAEALRAGGARADVVDCEAPPSGLRLDEYDAALVGGSVRGNRYRRSLRRFLRAGRDELARMPWAFFSVCLTVAATREDDRAAARELPRRFLRELALEPREVAVFAGALRFSRHRRLGARLLFAINRRYLPETDMDHDWVFTDWHEVDALAGGLTETLARGPGTGRGAATTGRRRG
jgi:menaquinone-dependent protoporphyrinogen oxidase